MKNLALKLAGLLSIALAVALFSPQSAAADQDDPPGRVARLSYTHGAVAFEPAGTDDWVTAVVNRPMTTGDKLWSDNGSRGELQIGTAVIRLSSNTGLSFLNLTDNTVQLQLTAGTLNIRVRRLDDDETFEVDTPNLAFNILRPGRYRINVNEAGDTTVVVVRDGQAEVTGGGSAYAIHAHEVATFTGTERLDTDVQRYDDEEDGFDRWCNERDRRWEHSPSARYVSNDVVGYEDLDDYGRWRAVPGYGTVWFPYVTVAGWAPYRYGHWAWISPWGWTWVDDEPWGFAPFHYGRWVFVNGYWGWVPCPPRPTVVDAYVRPVYAPALVVWVGGAQRGLGGGRGGVAWFPLGPREVYVPAYHVSQTYVTNVNITNTTVNNTYVTNVYNTTVVNKNVYISKIKYVNQGVPDAVTATSQTAFTSAQPVAKNIVKVDQKAIVSAPVGSAETPAIAPSKGAVLGAGGKATVAPPVILQGRAVVAKTAPPPPPAPFERQQEAIKANGGKPIAISQVRQLNRENLKASVPVKITPPAGTVAPQNTMSNRREEPQNASRPAAPGDVEQPRGGQPAQANNPSNQPPNINSRVHNDRPPSVRPSDAGGANVNPKLEQKHEQTDRPSNATGANVIKPQPDQKHEQENLRKQQELERQKVEPQYQQQVKTQQQKADERRPQEIQQKQQQQPENTERKHEVDQQKVQQSQQQERPKALEQSKPPKQEKEKDKDKDKDKDKPQGR